MLTLTRILLLTILLYLDPVSANKRTITIGSKAFSESVILGEMLSLILEKKFDVKVVRKLNLGGTQVVFNALKSKSIDVYPDYTGTGYIMILGLGGEKNPHKIYQIVSQEFFKRYQIRWSQPLGFNNTYALAIRKKDLKFSQIKKISQLKGMENQIRYISPHEFMERADGLKSLQKIYDLNFKESQLKAVNSGLMYSAIRDNEADLITSYSTDGRIQAYGLRLLEDDLSFFPPYYAAFLYKEESAREVPELPKAIHLLEGIISEAQMTKMNDQVDRLKQDPQKVAKNFLIKQNILSGTLENLEKNQNFISFTISKKNYLLKTIWEHIVLTFLSLFAAIVASIPTGIVMSRSQKLAKIIFPIVNTLQTIPSLALLGFLIPLVGIGTTPALIALFLYSLLPLIRNTYTGIKGVSPLFIEASQGIGLTKFQILTRVEIPLAMPVILAGIRTASVIIVGIATLAALVGAGGLGDPIFRGVATVNTHLILLGAIPSALLAVLLDRFLGWSEIHLVSRGLRINRKS